MNFSIFAPLSLSISLSLYPSFCMIEFSNEKIRSFKKIRIYSSFWVHNSKNVCKTHFHILIYLGKKLWYRIKISNSTKWIRSFAWCCDWVVGQEKFCHDDDVDVVFIVRMIWILFTNLKDHFKRTFKIRLDCLVDTMHISYVCYIYTCLCKDVNYTEENLFRFVHVYLNERMHHRSSTRWISFAYIADSWISHHGC